MLAEATEQVIHHRPGFVSPNLHASLEGTRVVNDAQWESEESLAGMWEDPACREQMHAAPAISTAEPRRCRVASVHHA